MRPKPRYIVVVMEKPEQGSTTSQTIVYLTTINGAGLTYKTPKADIERWVRENIRLFPHDTKFIKYTLSLTAAGATDQYQ